MKLGHFSCNTEVEEHENCYYRAALGSDAP